MALVYRSITNKIDSGNSNILLALLSICSAEDHPQRSKNFSREPGGVRRGRSSAEHIAALLDLA